MDAIKDGMLATAKAAEAAARLGEKPFGGKQKFNSQICTTREQSERLLTLGLKPETADMVWIPEVDFDAEGEPYDTGNYFERPIKGVWDYTLLDGISAWSLHRLIILIGNIACDWIFRNDDCYTNAINCIEWLIKEGYFNKEYLENGN